MSIFEQPVINILEDIRPVGASDPSVGFSNRMSKEDHKHQLEVPSEHLYDPVFLSNVLTTNITAVGKYWLDSRLWVDVEIGILFSGAPSAFTNFNFVLPFVPIAVEGGASAQHIGSCVMEDTGVKTYGGDIWNIAGTTSCGIATRVNPQGLWSYNSPWTVGNGDKASIIIRFRRSPNG